MLFGDRLKILREELGLSQQELAKKLNLTRATISKYENSPEQVDTYNTLIVMSNIFDVPIDYILGITDCREKYPASKPINEIEVLKEGIEALSNNDRKVVAEYIAALKKRSSKGSEE